MQSQTPQRLTFLPTTGDRVGWLTCDNSYRRRHVDNQPAAFRRIGKTVGRCCARPKKGDCRTAGRGRQKYLEDRSWLGIMGYGRERAKALGINTEADIDRLIAESRNE